MRHVMGISGGKDSTAMAVLMHRREPSVSVEYVFTDTGREMPEMYGFLDRLETVIGPIRRIWDGWHCDRCAKAGTDWDTQACPHCGGPVRPRDMNYYIDRWSTDETGPFLPSASSRWCTKHLKLRPFERFIGRDAATAYIGLRADEERDGNFGLKPNIAYRYPLQEWGIDLAGVMATLADAGITLPSFYSWRGVGGCWNCPFQRKRHWRGLAEHHPDLFAQACEEESKSQFKYSGSRKPLSVVIAEPDRGGEDDDMGGACLICAK